MVSIAKDSLYRVIMRKMMSLRFLDRLNTCSFDKFGHCANEILSADIVLQNIQTNQNFQVIGGCYTERVSVFQLLFQLSRFSSS